MLLSRVKNMIFFFAWLRKTYTGNLFYLLNTLITTLTSQMETVQKGFLLWTLGIIVECRSWVCCYQHINYQSCLLFSVNTHSFHVIFNRFVGFCIVLSLNFSLSCCRVPLVVISLLPPPCPALPFFSSTVLSYSLSFFPPFVCLWFQWTSVFPNAPFRGRKVLGVLKLPLKTQV